MSQANKNKVKISEVKIDSLIPDNLNANKGTEYGTSLMDKSFREFGAGRSILIDKNNRIIGGNKSTEKCFEIGIEDVIIVETDGTKLVAVKRNDIDLDTQKGRELALADNATSKANLSWDNEAIQKIESEWDIDSKEWGISISEIDEITPEEEEIKVISNKLTVECEDSNQLANLFDELQRRGFKCELKD